jgi:CheY-like chemotaxis protein
MRDIHILLVEDNEGDILLTTEAFEDSKLINKLTVIRDGKSAMLYFEDLDDDSIAPDLVLLDINLPKKSGQEVLQFIKQSDRFKHIPVIMLTTSSSDKDIMQAYRNLANCYITKPIEVGEFLNAVSKIEEFWISIVTMPPKNVK